MEFYVRYSSHNLVGILLLSEFLARKWALRKLPRQKEAPGGDLVLIVLPDEHTELEK